MSNRPRSLVLLAVPVVAALAVYLHTLDAGFVFDDRSQILQNPWVKQLRHLPRVISSPVWEFKVHLPTNYYRPIQMGLYNLLWAVSGGQPWAFHALNVLLHALNTLLLVLLVRRVSRDARLAFVVALLFAVHPLNSEAVAWVACLPELTYCAFSLATLLLHVRSWEAGGRRRAALRAAAVGSFTLALFSKETAAGIAGVAFLLEWLVRPAGHAGPAAARRLLRALRAVLPYALATGAYLLVRLAVVGGLAPLARTGRKPLDALVNGPHLLLSYLAAVLAPVRLSAYHVFHPLPSLLHPTALASLAGVGLLLVGGVLLARRRPELAVPASLFLFPLLPVLYVPAIGDNAFAERYAYVPAMGLLWLIAAGATALAGRLLAQRAPAATLGAAVVVSVVLGVMTVERASVWHDGLRFAAQLVRDEPHEEIGFLLLGDEQVAADRLQRALQVYEEGLERTRGGPNLAAKAVGVRLELGRISAAEAIDRLERLKASSPDALQVRLGLAFAYLRGDRLDDAEVALDRLEQRMPPTDGALLARAVIAARRGDDRAAVDYSREALAIDPSSAAAWQQLGVSLVRSGRAAEAVAALETAVGLRPADAGAHARLGAALLAAGRLDEARRALERALELDPGQASARTNLQRLEPASPADSR